MVFVVWYWCDVTALAAGDARCVLCCSHWILRFPAQCVLAAEECMWERLVFRALEKQDYDDLKLQR